MAGGPGGQATEGHVDTRNGTAGPEGLLRAVAEPEADARYLLGQLAGRGRDAGRRGDRGQSHVRLSLSESRIARRLVRRRRRAGEPGHGLVRDAGRAPAQALAGGAPRPPTGQRPRGLRARIGLLRHQWGGHRLVRRRVDVRGGRQARARRILAARRDGVGELRHALPHRSARRRRRGRQPGRLGLRGLVGGVGRPSVVRSAGQSHHRPAGGFRGGAAGAQVAGSEPHRSAGQQPQHGAVVSGGMRRRQLPGRRDHQERTGPVPPGGVAVLYRAAASDPNGCRTRSRTSASWTRSRRT